MKETGVMWMHSEHLTLEAPCESNHSLLMSLKEIKHSMSRSAANDLNLCKAKAQRAAIITIWCYESSVWVVAYLCRFLSPLLESSVKKHTMPRKRG